MWSISTFVNMEYLEFIFIESLQLLYLNKTVKIIIKNKVNFNKIFNV